MATAPGPITGALFSCWIKKCNFYQAIFPFDVTAKPTAIVIGRRPYGAYQGLRPEQQGEPANFNSFFIRYAMSASFDPSDFDLLKEYVISLFPSGPSEPIVSPQLQESEIHSLRRTIGSERFYFVVDMKTFEVTAMDGVQRWLGYYEKEFTLKNTGD